jgi:hypothetical protein
MVVLPVSCLCSPHTLFFGCFYQSLFCFGFEDSEISQVVLKFLNVLDTGHCFALFLLYVALCFGCFTNYFLCYVLTGLFSLADINFP